jgi:hypothetical protein
MAHFAELESKTDPTGFTSDTHMVVKRVVVVGNDCVPSDEHVDGETWCVNFFGGGIWKQTSYNNNFRKQYAGIGYTYDASKNKFIIPQPYKSWSLDDNDDWQAPNAFPSVIDDGQEAPSWYYRISWNESKYDADNSKGWEGIRSNDTAETPTVYDWNGSTWTS